MAKIVICVKHGTILFSGVCDKCRSEKIDKLLESSIIKRIKRWFLV